MTAIVTLLVTSSILMPLYHDDKKLWACKVRHKRGPKTAQLLKDHAVMVLGMEK